MEHLPTKSGNIFIMNHLENHPDTLLPNDFRLTLDSHFVSSMILFAHYGEAPIRVIRKPLLGWYGFQQYFDRLDYIYVYPGELDEEDRDQHRSHADRTREFIEKASAHLRAGRNVVIAPEGKCAYTDDSPGEFKVGAFRLAAQCHPEPSIVPIVLANFDKKLTQVTTAAIIHPAFRLSDVVHDPQNENELLAFVSDLRDHYRGYVKQAIALANE